MNPETFFMVLGGIVTAIAIAIVAWLVGSVVPFCIG